MGYSGAIHYAQAFTGLSPRRGRVEGVVRGRENCLNVDQLEQGRPDREAQRPACEIPAVCEDAMSLGLIAVVPIIAIFFGSGIALANLSASSTAPKLPLPFLQFLGFFLVPIILARLFGRFPICLARVDRDQEFVCFRHRGPGGKLEPTDVAIADIIGFSWRSQVRETRTVEWTETVVPGHGSPDGSYTPSSTSHNATWARGADATSYYSVAYLSDGQVVSFGAPVACRADAVKQANALAVCLGVSVSEDDKPSVVTGRVRPHHTPQWPAVVVLLSVIYCALPFLPWPAG